MSTLWVLLGTSLAVAQVNVKVEAPPVRFHESKTTTVTKQVISGPKGKRTVIYTGGTNSNEVPGTVRTDTVSDVEVSGVNDPGIKVERKVYYPGLRQPVDPGLVVEGGPGTIHTESTTKTRRTPKVQVQLNTK